jgi:hypothetical protein
MSYRYTFTGVIHPERAAVSVSTTGWNLHGPTAGIDGRLAVTIAVSQVTALFESDTEVSDLATLRNHVSDAIRIAVDAVGFLNGCGYDVEIVQLVPPEGNVPIVFGVDIPALQTNPAELSRRFTELIELFGESRSSHLQRCLADLREAIRSPKDTGFFCYRGIESLRQFFVLELGVKGDKESWETLRKALGIDRAPIDYVKEFADPVRHGKSKPISDAERAEVFRRTWEVVGRFIEFARAGYGGA